MSTIWDSADFDDHEALHFFRDAEHGLTAIIAIHSTVRGPASGGTRYWHYAEHADAVTDALRLSRGMSYKNAMAGLPSGGGKAVILAAADRQKSPAMIAAFARAVDSLAGRYVTAQDVGMSQADMVAIGQTTAHVAGLPATGSAAGGDPGPTTATGVYLGVLAAAREALGVDDLKGVHVAIQGLGSVGGGLARQLAAAGARLTVADVDAARAQATGSALGATIVPPDDIVSVEADILSPCALGAILTPSTIAQLRVKAVAGGANNQLASPADGDDLHARGILYAPDYVINAGGIINVMVDHLQLGDAKEVNVRVAQIPDRLRAIWAQSKASNIAPARIADAQARALIGRHD
ncbi:MAG: Leu/Phe/Val dehydrogenase [Sphingomonadaceae bacterium]